MQIREYSLPQGWFPRDPDEISREISGYLTGFTPENPSRAVIAPHAGWYYCGRLAAMSCASLDANAQTIIVVGGHLGSGSPALFAMEDAVRTPFGVMHIDTDLRSELLQDLGAQLRCAQDCYRDNTVEVLLPMARFFFPKANLIWLRLPAEIASFNAGITISRTAAKLNRKVNIIGSTDLTHYGKNYGFSPRGSGSAALRWVRDVNDAAFIKAVESGNAEETLRRAERDSSSCSAGAVLGVMGFAQEQALGSARLLEYATSADADRTWEPDSFVGYASMAWD